MIRAGLGVSATLVGIVAVWLLAVVVPVLSSRDPTAVPTWVGIGVAGLVAAGVTWLVALRRGRRVAGPARGRDRVVLGASGVVALAIGGVVLAAFAGSPHSEDVLLPIGLVFAAHGVLAVIAAIAPGPVMPG